MAFPHKKNKTKQLLSHVNPWIVGTQVPLSKAFSRKEYSSGLPFLSAGDLPDPGIKPRSLALQADSLLSKPLGKPCLTLTVDYSVEKRALHLFILSRDSILREGVEVRQRLVEVEFINLKDGRVLEIKSSILDQNSFQLVHSDAQSGFFYYTKSATRAFFT